MLLVVLAVVLAFVQRLRTALAVLISARASPAGSLRSARQAKRRHSLLGGVVPSTRHALTNRLTLPL